jgi:hypothetical protein
MEFHELTPEEKLFCALFGELFLTQKVRHFLPAEGHKAVRDMLEEFASRDTRSASRVFRERGIKVLRLRFGFEPRTNNEKMKPHKSDCRSLGEVGVCLGVTRERIRQIEWKTMRFLRHPVYLKKLKEYYPSWAGGEMLSKQNEDGTWEFKISPSPEHREAGFITKKHFIELLKDDLATGGYKLTKVDGNYYIIKCPDGLYALVVGPKLPAKIPIPPAKEKTN